MVKERADEVNCMENENKVDSVQERFPNDDLQLNDKDKHTVGPEFWSSVENRFLKWTIALWPGIDIRPHPWEKSVLSIGASMSELIDLWRTSVR